MPISYSPSRNINTLLKILIFTLLLLQISGCSKVMESTPVLFGTMFNLKTVGYKSKEYFISGTAHSYLPVGELTTDGQWVVEENDQAQYTTRIMVKRPIDPADFNGTVIVEWNNVSGNTDAPAEWNFAHTEFTRGGYAWIGVSAQRKGIDNVGEIGLLDGILDASLKTVNPARYDILNHPGDNFSYSMFHQIAHKIRHPEAVDFLEGLNIERMIAAGESQSAARMITYINILGKTENLFDGFFVHSRFGSSAPVSELPLEEAIPGALVKIREDLHKPVMLLQTETDLFVESFLPGNAYENRQDDTDYFRLWEVAGTAHADTYSTLGLFDRGTTSLYAQLVSQKFAIPFIAPCENPVNGNPIHHFTVNAAFHALDLWLRDGTLPTIADRLEIEDESRIAIDDLGNAIGGIRSAYVDAPLATYSGVGEGHVMCMIFGTMVKFDSQKLSEIYESREDYLNQVRQSLDTAVEQKFLVPVDADKIWLASQKMAKKIPE